MKFVTPKRWFWVILIILCALPIVYNILQQGFWVSDDGEWMIIRLSAFYQELRGGQFPVRWLGRLNHESGYPVPNFLYPGFLYFGSFIHLLGFGVVDTIKLIFAGSVVGLGINLFLWLRRLFDHHAALLGAVSGMYVPYVVFDIFHRGSVGEVFALASAPLIFYGIEKNFFLIASLSYGWLILAHNTVALIMTPVVIIYTFVRDRRFLLAMIFGLGIASFFWIPAIVERKFVIFDQLILADWQHYFVNSQPLTLIGILGVVDIFLILYLLWQKTVRINRVFHLMVLVTLASFYFSSQASGAFWQVTPLAKFVQFPWRFLGLLSITIPFTVSLFFTTLTQSKYRQAFIGVLFLSCAASLLPYRLLARFNKGDAYYETNDSTTTVQNEYMPIWVKHPPVVRPPQKIEARSDDIKITIHSLRSTYMELLVDSPKEDRIDVRTLYYPGWKVIRENEVLMPEEFVEDGHLTVPVKAGKQRVRIVLRETPLRLFSDIISLVSLLALLALYFNNRLKQIFKKILHG